MVCLLVAGELPEHLVMKPSVIGRLRHLEGSSKALLRFGMPESEELEFERQDRPRPIVDQPNNEFAKGFQALLSTRTLPQTAGKPINIRPGTMLKESKEQIFLALEVRIDRPFASVRCGGNLVELGRLIPIPNKHFFGGNEKPGLRLPGSKLLFTQSLHGDFSHLNTSRVFIVDTKPTGQYLSSMPQAIEVEALSAPRTQKKAVRVLIAGLAALFVCGAATGWGVYSQGYEATDDAQLDGHLNVVSARISGTTAAVYVTDNQVVEPGQPLVDLDPSEQKVAYAQAKAQYDQAVAQLNSQRPTVAITEADNAAAAITSDAQLIQVRAASAAASQDQASASAKLVEAEAVRTRDEADLQRYEQLFRAGTISRQDYERALAAARSAEANATAAKANVASAEKLVEERKAEIDAQVAKREQIARTSPRQLSIRQADLATSEANVEASAAQLQRAALNLSFCHIVSPVRGIVTQRSAEIGNRVSEAQPLMMIVASGDTWVTANFKETQLARMRAGQRAKVHIDALKKDFEGTVEGIPAITGARSSVLPPENATGNYIKVVQRMPVRIRLNANQDNLDRLRPGMSVEATVWLR